VKAPEQIDAILAPLSNAWRSAVITSGGVGTVTSWRPGTTGVNAVAARVVDDGDLITAVEALFAYERRGTVWRR
jgi:hypothetical protein